MLSFIVAVSENNVIGKDNSLIWHLPSDLKRFKEITSSGSKTMIMGRKTFETLPHVLPGRRHIILTRNENYKIKNEAVTVINDIASLKPMIEAEEEFFVIGGGEIYSLLMPYAKNLYLTMVHENFSGDTFFPDYKEFQWNIIKKQEGVYDKHNRYKSTLLILERK